MTKRRDGRSWPISSRFERERRLKTLDAQAEWYQEKLIQAGLRINVDVRDEQVQKKFLKRFEKESRSDLRDLDNKEYAERFLEMAYFQHLIISGNRDETEIIDALCLGNWLVGVLVSMTKIELFDGMCAPCAIKAHASKIGKAGAAKKLAPLRELESWTRAKYAAGAWPSANRAAHELKDAVIDHGRKLGAVLTEQNAQRTIAGWLRKK
ncbi:hypothetical protein [Massilia sp. S19_KUP03_FR1]|uniref:hypothetical protein n=1 Tax=Massilia sp. S19_KUP03_FR1 TaxID=3025503 RepID=UPI002FCCBA8F